MDGELEIINSNFIFRAEHSLSQISNILFHVNYLTQLKTQTKHEAPFDMERSSIYVKLATFHQPEINLAVFGLRQVFEQPSPDGLVNIFGQRPGHYSWTRFKRDIGRLAAHPGNLKREEANGEITVARVGDTWESFELHHRINLDPTKLGEHVLYTPDHMRIAQSLGPMFTPSVTFHEKGVDVTLSGRTTEIVSSSCFGGTKQEHLFAHPYVFTILDRVASILADTPMLGRLRSNHLGVCLQGTDQGVQEYEVSYDILRQRSEDLLPYTVVLTVG
jgi:hypothetical protein